MVEAKVVRRQAVLIRKVADRDVKFNKSRLSLFKGGKYKGWVSRKEFNKMVKESNGSLFYKKARAKDRKRLKLNPTTFKKNVVVIFDDERRTQQFFVRVHTKEQKKFVVEQFGKKKIPLPLKGKRISDLLGSFRMAGIRVIQRRGETP